MKARTDAFAFKGNYRHFVRRFIAIDINGKDIALLNITGDAVSYQ